MTYITKILYCSFYKNYYALIFFNAHISHETNSYYYLTNNIKALYISAKVKSTYYHILSFVFQVSLTFPSAFTDCLITIYSKSTIYNTFKHINLMLQLYKITHVSPKLSYKTVHFSPIIYKFINMFIKYRTLVCV